MFLQRSALQLARRAALAAPIAPRVAFTTTTQRLASKRPSISLFPQKHPTDVRKPMTAAQKGTPPPEKTVPTSQMKSFNAVTGYADLMPPGAPTGVVPSDLEQATGLERLEILGKMENIDIFDMKPLDASRMGTLDNPIIVRSFGDEQYAGCTGFPADSHVVIWLTMSRGRPVERCPECGNVLKMEYVGPQEDPHAHGHDGEHDAYEEPKTFADYVRPEYT